MENKHSSDGIAEDLIRTFVQFGCAELHTKTLIEKAEAEIKNNIIDIDDMDAMQKQADKLDNLNEQLVLQASMRRKLMLKLFDMFDGNKDYWCEVKHIGIGAYTLFECYQASDNDTELYMLALEANELFISALSQFLGKEITSCASCFADFVKERSK